VGEYLLKEVQTVVTQLIDVRMALRQGTIYQSVPEKILTIMDNVAYKSRRTHVIVPDDESQIMTLLETINQRLNQDDKKATVTDLELDQLLQHIVSPNTKIRDKGIFNLFNRLLRKYVLTAEQVVWVKDRLISDDYLFAHILEPENDGIFLRSFSVMFLAGILYANRTHYHVLTEAELVAIELRVMAYAIIELDSRGYVADKGWAHALTHIINVWSELNETQELQRADKLLMMAVLIQAYRFSDNALAYGEDSHLANVLMVLLKKNQLYTDYFLAVLQDWQKSLLNIVPEDSIAFWNRWYNRNRFLQSLMLQPELPTEIDDYLRKISDLF